MIHALTQTNETLRRSIDEERRISDEIDAKLGITIHSYRTDIQKTKKELRYKAKRTIKQFAEYLQTLDIPNVLITKKKVLIKKNVNRFNLVLNINKQHIKFPGGFAENEVERSRQLFTTIYNDEVRRRYSVHNCTAAVIKRKPIVTIGEFKRYLRTLKLPRKPITIESISAYVPKTCTKALILFNYKRTVIRHPQAQDISNIEKAKTELLELINTEINRRPQVKYPILPFPKAFGGRNDEEFKTYLTHVILPLNTISIERITHIRKRDTNEKYRLAYRIENTAIYYNRSVIYDDLIQEKEKFLNLLNAEIQNRNGKQK